MIKLNSKPIDINLIQEYTPTTNDGEDERLHYETQDRQHIIADEFGVFRRNQKRDRLVWIPY